MPISNCQMPIADCLCPVALYQIGNWQSAIDNIREWLANPGCSSLEQRRLSKVGT